MSTAAFLQKLETVTQFLPFPGLGNEGGGAGRAL